MQDSACLQGIMQAVLVSLVLTPIQLNSNSNNTLHRNCRYGRHVFYHYPPYLSRVRGGGLSPRLHATPRVLLLKEAREAAPR